jgi:hypothetical protein
MCVSSTITRADNKHDLHKPESRAATGTMHNTLFAASKGQREGHDQIKQRLTEQYAGVPLECRPKNMPKVTERRGSNCSRRHKSKKAHSTAQCSTRMAKEVPLTENLPLYSRFVLL